MIPIQSIGVRRSATPSNRADAPTLPIVGVERFVFSVRPPFAQFLRL